MAKQSPIAKLAAKPLGYKLGVLAGVVAILGFVYFQFFLSSMNEDLDSAKASYKKLGDEKDKLGKRKAEWTKMVNEQKEIDAKISANKVSLPQDAALPSFMGHLQRQAAVAGVSFRSIKPLKEEPVSSYVKVPVAVEITGSFHQIMRYFYLLMETERIITVENFSMLLEKTETDDQLIKSTFRATTFRQSLPEDADLSPAAPSAPATAPDTKGAAAAPGKGAAGQPDGSGADQADKPASGVDRLKGAGSN